MPIRIHQHPTKCFGLPKPEYIPKQRANDGNRGAASRRLSLLSGPLSDIVFSFGCGMWGAGLGV